MMLPQKAPRVSASQSPRSLPVRFSKNDWWNSSQIPISEREMVTVKMRLRQDGLFAKKIDAERRPLPPKKKPKWTILSKWGISKGKVPGGWNLFPWDSRLRTTNQAVKQPIQKLGLWRNLLGVIPMLNSTWAGLTNLAPRCGVSLPPFVRRATVSSLIGNLEIVIWQSAWCEKAFGGQIGGLLLSIPWSLGREPRHW